MVWGVLAKWKMRNMPIFVDPKYETKKRCYFFTEQQKSSFVRIWPKSVTSIFFRVLRPPKCNYIVDSFVRDVQIWPIQKSSLRVFVVVFTSSVSLEYMSSSLFRRVCVWLWPNSNGIKIDSRMR